mgnify:CR=1 FL=1
MSTFEIKMPKLGESITEGTIVSWSVKVGDAVQEDDVLFEVSHRQSQCGNTLSGCRKGCSKLLFSEGDTVAVVQPSPRIQLGRRRGRSTRKYHSCRS